MTKIRPFDLSLTLAAFAALVFLLPADREPPARNSQDHQLSTQQGPTKTADTYANKAVSNSSI